MTFRDSKGGEGGNFLLMPAHDMRTVSLNPDPSFCNWNVQMIYNYYYLSASFLNL